MSCAWDVVCVDCWPTLGFDAKHGFGDGLRRDVAVHIARSAPLLFELAGLLEAFCASDPTGAVSPRVRLVDWDEGTTARLAFFRTHAGHTLRAIDEYGNLDNDHSPKRMAP